MGRNSRRRRNKNWYRRRNQDDDGNSNLSEVELILVQKFLSDYRLLAYNLRKRHNVPCSYSKPLIIGEHTFPSLTDELCGQPFIDLPHTLTAKDRHKIHAFCSHADLYHTGIGKKSRRRIVISIYADGFRFIPDEELESSLGSFVGTSKFPFTMCKPFYCLDENMKAGRLCEIEDEKNLIHQFVLYPEMTLQHGDPLNLADIEALDLSSAPSVEETTYELIDTITKLELCVKELKYGCGDNDTGDNSTKLNEIAFDMEMYNQGNIVRTCLIQLTSNTVQKDYVIDPLAPGVWDAIGSNLGPLFSDQNIVKIGHGIGGMDCSSLYRDFGILVVNAFDTCEASSILRQSSGGMNLASLCKHYGLQKWEHYRDLKDRFQTTNWCKRPLSMEALEYGRYDVRYMIPLRQFLTRDLMKMDMMNYVSREVDTESNFDSTLATENNGESFLSDGSHLSSTPGSLFADSARPAEKDCLHVSSGAAISVSDMSSFETLMKAISISQKRCLKLLPSKKEESMLKNQFMSMIKQSAKVGEGNRAIQQWTEENTKLYLELANWRKDVAERENVDANDVCSLDLLCWVSYKLPLHRTELQRFEYILPTLIEDRNKPYFDEMLKIVSTKHINRNPSDVVYYLLANKVQEEVHSVFRKKERQIYLATTIICFIAIAITVKRK